MMNLKTLATLGLLTALPHAGHAQFLPCNPNSPLGAVGCAGQVLQQMAPPRPAAQPQAAPPVAAPAPATQPPVAQPAPQPQQQTATRPPDSGASTASEVGRLTKKYVDDETATYGALKAELSRMGWRQSKTIEPIAPSYTYCGWEYATGSQVIVVLVYCVDDGKDPARLKAQVARISIKTQAAAQPAAQQPQAAASISALSGKWQVPPEDRKDCGIVDMEEMEIRQNKMSYGMPPWDCVLSNQAQEANGALRLTYSCKTDSQCVAGGCPRSQQRRETLLYQNGKIVFQRQTYVKNACP
jgi:hypothetical protein